MVPTWTCVSSALPGSPPLEREELNCGAIGCGLCGFGSVDEEVLQILGEELDEDASDKVLQDDGL